MDPNGFDHDDGMNAFTVEKSTVIRKKGVYVGGAPAYLMTQVHKERDLFSVVVSLFLVLWPLHSADCMTACYSSCFLQLKVIELCCLSTLCTVAIEFAKHTAAREHLQPWMHST